MLSNAHELGSADTALFIRVGNTRDEISLYQRLGGANVLLIDGMDGVTNSSSSELRLRAIIKGDSLLMDYATDLTNVIFTPTEKIAFDTLGLLVHQAHAGILIRQSTVSFFNDHYFDNLAATPIQKDTSKPIITYYTTNDSNSITLFFNEKVDLDLQDKLVNYRILETGQNPNTIVSQSQDSVRLVFGTAFPSGQKQTLQLDSLRDLAGNVSLKEEIEFTYLRIVEPTYKTLLISELFPKPGSTGITSEAFEIFNASNDYVSTLGLIFSDLSTDEPLPTQILPPKSYWVVCDDGDTVDFSGLNILPLKSMPSLNDGEDLIRIEHPKNGIITQLLYQESWHDDAKQEGGWSLEMKDQDKGCVTSNNYGSSIASNGHTLGLPNSTTGLLAAGQTPRITSIYVSKDSQIIMRWNQVIDFRFATDMNSYSLNPSGIAIDSIRINKANHREYSLHLNASITGPTQFSMNSFISCDGNQVDAQVFNLNKPKSIKEGDLRIVEILFNASTGCSEFIELDNTTGSILDLKNTFMGIASNTKREVFDIVDKGYLLFPGQKLVLAQDLDALQQCHTLCDNALYLELQKWSSLDDKQGQIWIIDFANQRIDTINYQDQYHSRLLSNTDGVSLEKTDTTGSGLNRAAWSSSSLSQNYASPGCANTPIALVESSKPFRLSNPYFQSTSSSYPKAIVQYELMKSNYSLQIEVRNRKGILVKRLANNDLIGTEGNYTWDGSHEDGQNVAIGIYYIYIKGIHSDGTSIKQVLEVTKLD